MVSMSSPLATFSWHPISDAYLWVVMISSICVKPLFPRFIFSYATRIKIWISAHYPQPISCVVGLRKGSVKGPLLTIWWIDRKQSAGSRQTSDDIQTMSINKLGNMWVLLRRKCFDGDWFVSFIDAAWLMIFFSILNILWRWEMK